MRAPTMLSITTIAMMACAHATTAATPADTARPREWVDASGHRNLRIPVDGTTIHAIDYGGAGQPLVFLAGLGNSAHVFDELAPRFNARHRVVALTRRGFGESGRPAHGYDTRRLSSDILAAIDSLGLGAVVLVGHSVAGDELSDIGARHRERVAALVYLDAAYDRTGTRTRLLRLAITKSLPPTPPKPTAEDRASPEAYRAYLALRYGVAWPLAEVRATRVFDAEGRYTGDATAPSVNLAILGGEEAPQYERIGAPVLSIYAVQHSVARDYPWIARMVVGRGVTEQQARRAIAAQERWEAGERRRLARALPGARIVEIAGASHYVFISDPERVVVEIDRFLAGVAAPR